MGLSMKNTRSADFCADRIDVITNLAVITNAVMKRVHCIWASQSLYCLQMKQEPFNHVSFMLYLISVI